MLLLISLIVTALATGIPECKSIACPPYSVVKEGDGYEVRSYPKTMWATTTFVHTPDYDQSLRTGFMRLFAYISGANDQKSKIKMTAPVISIINTTAEPGPFCAASITIGFYLNLGHPTPSSSDVHITELPAQTVVVGSFSGFLSNQTVTENAYLLAQAVTRDGIRVNEEVWSAAGYDSPFRVFHRHNEIWFTKE